MSEILVDGRKYVLSQEGKDELTQEREELAERIRTFTLEGKTYWRDRFIEFDDGMYSEGDEAAPFFSEAFLYNLLGKDEARSVLGIIRHLSALAGVEYR